MDPKDRVIKGLPCLCIPDIPAVVITSQRLAVFLWVLQFIHLADQAHTNFNKCHCLQHLSLSLWSSLPVSLKQIQDFQIC